MSDPNEPDLSSSTPETESHAAEAPDTESTGTSDTETAAAESADTKETEPASWGLVAVGVVLVGAIIAGVLWFGRGDEENGSKGLRMSPAESHAKMVATLKGIADRTAQDNPYLSDRSVQRFRADLAGLGDGAPAVKRCELHFALGDAEARLGRLRPAIDNLTKAVELIPEAKLPPATADYVRFKLGVAWLRLGETENCCQRNNAESCIVPIQGGGVHEKTEGSTNAIRWFEEVLRSKSAAKHEVTGGASNSGGPLDTKLASRWLLNLAHMTLGTYPDKVPAEFLIPAKAFESETKFPRFANVARQLGLDTFNMCGGAILDDFDNDGYLDIITSTWDPKGQLRYFRNKADGTFEDRTAAAGLTGLFGGLNLIQADYDNDGNLDFVVLRGAWLGPAGMHPNSLVRNNGDGTFSDMTFAAGLGDVHYPTQTGAFADYDNDGDVDLFIGNEGSKEVPAPAQLFRNNGNGTFTDVAAQAGVQNFGFAKGACFGDVDGDRFAELYVSNYMGQNRFYQNNRNGTFVDIAPQLKLTGPVASFPTWFWDFDNDGRLDLFVASYTGRVDQLAAHYLGQKAEFEMPALYHNRGGELVNVAEEQGIAYPMLPMGSNFGDIDGDGWLDFYLGTGDPDYHSLMPNAMFRNKGYGQGFQDVTMAGGFGHLQKGHGIAFGDLDNDGDLDLFEQMGGAFRGDEFGDALFENPGFGAKWISIQLVGTKSNRSAIGAHIRVEVLQNGQKQSIYRRVNSGGSFGASSLRQTIGLGNAERILQVDVLWPTSDSMQTFKNMEMNQIIQVVEGAGSAMLIPVKKLQLGG